RIARPAGVVRFDPRRRPGDWRTETAGVAAVPDSGICRPDGAGPESYRRVGRADASPGELSGQLDDSPPPAASGWKSNAAGRTGARSPNIQSTNAGSNRPGASGDRSDATEQCQAGISSHSR